MNTFIAITRGRGRKEHRNACRLINVSFTKACEPRIREKEEERESEKKGSERRVPDNVFASGNERADPAEMFSRDTIMPANRIRSS